METSPWLGGGGQKDAKQEKGWRDFLGAGVGGHVGMVPAQRWLKANSLNI